MKVTGLELDLSQIFRIIEAEDDRATTVRTADGVTSKATRVAVVSAEVLAETLQRHPKCRCEDLGLRTGMAVTDLINLGSGCTGCDSPFTQSGGWVCERLITVRKRYGK